MYKKLIFIAMLWSLLSGVSIANSNDAELLVDCLKINKSVSYIHKKQDNSVCEDHMFNASLNVYEACVNIDLAQKLTAKRKLKFAHSFLNLAEKDNCYLTLKIQKNKDDIKVLVAKI